MTRLRSLALSLVLGIGVLAMHSLVLPMASAAHMPMAAHQHAMPAAPSPAGGTLPGESARASMTGCAGHACLAARGSAAGGPLASPGADGGILLPRATHLERAPASAVSLRAPRPPPRSGPCSPLCVWRV